MPTDCKASFSLFWGIRWQGLQGDGEVIRERPMFVFAFAAAITGACAAVAATGRYLNQL